MVVVTRWIIQIQHNIQRADLLLQWRVIGYNVLEYLTNLQLNNLLCLNGFKVIHVKETF